MTQDKYLSIVRHYEDCLLMHGDNHKGVDWPNLSDALKRYQVMLDLIKGSGGAKVVLDFGCGASHFYEYMLSSGRNDLRYVGLEISENFYSLSKEKYKNNNYILGDILKNPEILPKVDYVIMNGVFTEKLNLSFEEMEDYFQKMIALIFNNAKIGIAFNLMSISVDWQRDDLFHYPLDRLSNFLCKKISRNYIVRNDYGLYEYTVYIYR